MATPKVYPEGLLGKKLGMTHVFSDTGECIPVTVIQAGPCYVLDVKSKDAHGYSAVQFGFDPKKPQRVNKAEMGHFKRTGKGAFYHVREVRCDVEALGWGEQGLAVSVDQVFQDGDFVDISGTSIGRGFSGVVRRHNVRGQPATRGTHEYRRHIGSIGCRKFPGRVLKNQAMPGQHGNARSTVQNLRVVAIKPDENLLLVKGAVPGPRGSLVEIRRAVKRYKRREAQAA